MRSSQRNPSRRRRTTKREVARLNALRIERRLTLAMVAVEAAKTARFGTCSIPTVSKALSEKSPEPNENVLNALRRLLGEGAEALGKAS